MAISTSQQGNYFKIFYKAGVIPSTDPYFNQKVVSYLVQKLKSTLQTNDISS
jgi:hypothetical protein